MAGKTISHTPRRLRSLLDKALLTYGSGLGDGSTHQYSGLPIIVVGGGKHLTSGKHINMPEGTPLANLWLTQARRMGLKLDRFADSTGEIGALKAGQLGSSDSHEGRFPSQWMKYDSPAPRVRG